MTGINMRRRIEIKTKNLVLGVEGAGGNAGNTMIESEWRV